MLVRNLLMPVLTQHWLSEGRLRKARQRAERARQSRGEPHRILYFHQVDDPYSALLAQCLGDLVRRYAVDLVPHVVGPPSDAAAPDRARLIAYSRIDGQRLAQHRNIRFGQAGGQPAQTAVHAVQRALVAAIPQGRFIELAAILSSTLWQAHSTGLGTGGPEDPMAGIPQASSGTLQAHLASAQATRRRLGHYLGATLYYAGEWYWGIDRLHHLEARLQELGVQRPGVSGALFPPDAEIDRPIMLKDPPVIDFFFSLRSPYSAIAASRVFKLGRLTGAPVRLRPVMPMVMRGLPVPLEKRLYISLDAAREARLWRVPFGRICDPVGRPVERGLSLIPLAEGLGHGQAYVLSFMQGVWAEGIDAGSDRGLRRIVERVGISWGDAQTALHDDRWRLLAESNRKHLLDLGLWGVPSFKVRDMAVWGQDRLWAVQQALLDGR